MACLKSGGQFELGSPRKVVPGTPLLRDGWMGSVLLGQNYSTWHDCFHVQNDGELIILLGRISHLKGKTNLQPCSDLSPQ